MNATGYVVKFFHSGSIGSWAKTVVTFISTFVTTNSPASSGEMS
jgi:hypothetical protein